MHDLGSPKPGVLGVAGVKSQKAEVSGEHRERCDGVLGVVEHTSAHRQSPVCVPRESQKTDNPHPDHRPHRISRGAALPSRQLHEKTAHD